MQPSATEYSTEQYREARRAQTFASYARERLDALCGAAQFSEAERPRACAELTEVLEPLGDVQIGARPRQPSDLSDDSFPLEFSITFTGGEPEVRVLFEQSWDPAPDARWQAARELNARLGERSAVRLDRLAAIEDLFAADPPLSTRSACPQADDHSHAPLVT